MRTMESTLLSACRRSEYTLLLRSSRPALFGFRQEICFFYGGSLMSFDFLFSDTKVVKKNEKTKKPVSLSGRGQEKKRIWKGF